MYIYIVQYKGTVDSPTIFPGLCIVRVLGHWHRALYNTCNTPITW